MTRKNKTVKNVNVICLPTEHQGVHRTRSETQKSINFKRKFTCLYLASNNKQPFFTQRIVISDSKANK